MNALEIIALGTNILRKAYYRVQINLLSQKLEETPKYSYDYSIRRQRLEKYLTRYFDLKYGKKTR